MVYRRQVGARVRRKEDPRLITGSSTYVDDFRPSDIGYLGVLRSIYGHAKINGIDTSKAAALPGVIGVYTAKDFANITAMPFGNSEGGGVAGEAPIATPVLENERVRHVGQAIAVVVATERYIAADAVDLIEVDYEPLPAVTDMEEALKDGAPQIYDHVPNNLAYTFRHKAGDPEAVFANAPVVVSQKMN